MGLPTIGEQVSLDILPVIGALSSYWFVISSHDMMKGDRGETDLGEVGEGPGKNGRRRNCA